MGSQFRQGYNYFGRYGRFGQPLASGLFQVLMTYEAVHELVLNPGESVRGSTLNQILSWLSKTGSFRLLCHIFLPQGGQPLFIMMTYENQSIISFLIRILGFNRLRTTRSTLSAWHSATNSCRT